MKAFQFFIRSCKFHGSDPVHYFCIHKDNYMNNCNQERCPIYGKEKAHDNL